MRIDFALQRHRSRARSAEPRTGCEKRLTIKGFIVSDSNNRIPEFLAEVGPLLASGRLRAIERAPQAFIDLLRGDQVGRMIVKLT